MNMPHLVENTIPVIAVDGPTASGKGAVAQAVARALGFHYLDSGALYRLIGLLALRAGWTTEMAFDVAHEQQLSEWARGLDVRFVGEQIVLNGEDVSAAIRQEATGNMASKIATVGVLREALLQRQRDFAQAPGLVADGRDMASVVFPEATVKIFLTADAQIRAERRYKQLIDKGFSANMANLVVDLHARDARDMARAFAPLKPVADAYVLDTSHMSLAQAIQTVVDQYESAVNKG